MKIASIILKSVMSHKSTDINLPERGVVIVEGPNGAGKSAILEGVSVGLFGESLRKKPVWSDDTGAIAIKMYDRDLHVQRTKKGKKISLWFPGNTYETTTKAQTALEQIIGNHELWRRQSVFSSQDADRFTTDSDSTRKKLLEDILGLDRFDRALAACRAELKTIERKQEQAAHKLALDAQRKDTTKQRLMDARARLADLPEPPPPVDAFAFEAEVDEHKKILSTANREIAKLDELVRSAAQEEKRLARAKAVTSCETCGSAYGKAHLDKIHNDWLEAQDLHEERMVRRKHSVTVLMEEARKAGEQIDKLNQRRGEARAQEAERTRIESQRNTLEDAVQELTQAYEEVCDSVTESELASVELYKEVGILTATEQVLSLRGVRAHLLSSAIQSVQVIANAWMEKLTGRDLKLKLTPYTENASGTINDSISLEVEGAGGGYGYKAASGGERRRIDIALMLALGEIAEYASGDANGTLFLDELLDALDTDGVQAATDVLHALALKRCVVVVTHNAELMSSLRPKLHLHVEAGKVTEV